jgi:hypothetical protein
VTQLRKSGACSAVLARKAPTVYFAGPPLSSLQAGYNRGAKTPSQSGWLDGRGRLKGGGYCCGFARAPQGRNVGPSGLLNVQTPAAEFERQNSALPGFWLLKLRRRTKPGRNRVIDLHENDKRNAQVRVDHNEAPRSSRLRKNCWDALSKGGASAPPQIAPPQFQ